MIFWLKIVGLIMSVIIGGVLIELFRKPSHLKLLLSFSGGFLLTIIFTHILPESYSESGKFIGYFILIGFLLQLVLEYFSQGAEHGHAHVHKSDSKKAFPIAVFISLSIHAFIEAIPLDHGHHAEVHDLALGVVLHKIPVAVALMTIFRSYGFSRLNSWIFLGAFSLVAPFGLLIGESMLEVISIKPEYVLAVAVGMFLHISTTIIFESSEGHKINLLKLTAIILGFVAGFLMS